jgi:diphosphomevalonate decarboxylase
VNRSSLSRLKTLKKSRSFLTGTKVSASWRSPSNIALVKYWGKKDRQIPLNPSVSMTLTRSYTLTSVEAMPSVDQEFITVNGDTHHPFIQKIDQFLRPLVKEIPALGELSFRVETKNSFPHSTGIASSASGFSAFVLCLLNIAEMVSGEKIPSEEFLNAASFVSRLGSGSACRSVYSGFSLWGETDLVPGSSDLFAVPINDRIHPSLKTLHDAILVISSNPKRLPSSSGHALMEHHPFAVARISQVKNNISEILKALDSGDIEHLAGITENEALTLHALIMTSGGGPILLEPSSVKVISQIREARQKGLPVFFSLDAGPNVHLFYPDQAVEQVEQFITDELEISCEKGSVILDWCGSGPERQEI